MPKIDRQAIYQRDSGNCGFCGQSVPWELLHLDHRQPKGLGGPTTAENLRVAHKVCNIRAGRAVRSERRRLGLISDSATIRFPKSLRARAIAVGNAEDRTFASLVIYALRRYVNEAEKRDA